MTTREALHDLLDELPESMLDFAEASLQRLRSAESDPFWKAQQNAPVDDEPLTPEELQAIEEGLASMREGRGVPHAAVKRLLGL